MSGWLKNVLVQIALLNCVDKRCYDLSIIIYKPIFPINTRIIEITTYQKTRCPFCIASNITLQTFSVDCAIESLSPEGLFYIHPHNKESLFLRVISTHTWSSKRLLSLSSLASKLHFTNIATPRIPDAPRFDSAGSNFTSVSYPLMDNCVKDIEVCCALGITSVINMMSGSFEVRNINKSPILLSNWLPFVYKQFRP